MALDRKYMLMLTGVGKDKIDILKLSSSRLSVCPPSVVRAFNVKHRETEPSDHIHGELALRMFPYLRDAYLKTTDLLSTARSYTRHGLGTGFPAPDHLSGLTDLRDAALEVVEAIDIVKRRDRVTEEHTIMKNAIDAVVPSYFALATVCEQALRD